MLVQKVCYLGKGTERREKVYPKTKKESVLFPVTL